MEFLKNKKENNGKTVNQILEQSFKDQFLDEALANISATTLRKRLTKAIQDKKFVPCHAKKINVSNTIIQPSTQSSIQIDQNDSEYIENVFSQELQQSLSLNPNQNNQNVEYKNRIEITNINCQINQYSTDLNEFLEPLKKEKGRIEDYSFSDFVRRFNLKECHVNNDGLSIFSCIRLFLKIVHGQELNLDQVYKDLKEVNSELIAVVFEPSDIEEFLKEYTQWIEKLFFYGIFENRLLKILPHVFKLNLIVLDTMLEHFKIEHLKIDF